MWLCMWLFPPISHSHTCHSPASAWPQASCDPHMGRPSMPPSTPWGQNSPQPEPQRPQLSASNESESHFEATGGETTLTSSSAQTSQAAAELGQRQNWKPIAWKHAQGGWRVEGVCVNGLLKARLPAGGSSSVDNHKKQNAKWSVSPAAL